LAELNAKAEDPNFWNKPVEAQSLMRERTRLDSALSRCAELERGPLCPDGDTVKQHQGDREQTTTH